MGNVWLSKIEKGNEEKVLGNIDLERVEEFSLYDVHGNKARQVETCLNRFLICRKILLSNCCWPMSYPFLFLSNFV